MAAICAREFSPQATIRQCILDASARVQGAAAFAPLHRTDSVEGLGRVKASLAALAAARP